MEEQNAQQMSSVKPEKPADAAEVELDLIAKDSKEVVALDPGPPVHDQTNFLPFRQLMIVYGGLALAIFLAALDQLIVVTASPKIVADFNGLSLISWIFNAYSLTSTSLMPVYGRFSDVFGRKVTILFAIAAFELGSLLAGVSQSMTQLIVFRAIQGVGAGGIQAMVFVIIGDIVSLQERGKYQGIIGAVWGLSGVVGPLVGGAFSDHISWRWCFLINLPLGAISAAVIFFFLKLKSVPGNARSKLARIDWLGTLAIVTATTFVLLPTIWGGSTYAWNSPIVIGFYCAAAVVIAIFFYIETYVAKEPVIPFNLFKNQSVSAGLACSFFYGGIFFGILSYISVYFQVVRGDTATASGLALIPWMFSLVITSAVSGIFISITGLYRPFIWSGGVLMTVGVGLFYRWDASISKAEVIGELIFLGFALGLSMQTFILALQASAPYKDLAITIALAAFFRSMGGVLANAIGAALFNNSLFGTLDSLNLSPDVYASASRDPLFVYSLPPGQLRDDITEGYVNAIKLTFLACIPFGMCCFFVSGFIKHYSLKKTGGPSPME